jgi:hypothetical protein
MPRRVLVIIGQKQTGRDAMRFMVMVKANNDTEAGVLPTTEMIEAMGRFNEEMVKAGVMQAGEGLHPSSKGARLSYSGAAAPTVKHGPFAGGLIAGFWLIETASFDEAIGWMKRAPFQAGDQLEIRQILAAEDFGEAFTPELRDQEERLRAEVTARHG